MKEQQHRQLFEKQMRRTYRKLFLETQGGQPFWFAESTVCGGLEFIAVSFVMPLNRSPNFVAPSQ